MFDSAVSAGVANVGSVVLKDDGFLEFYNEFDRNLDDLQAAFKKTKQTKALAESLKSRGTFKNFMGGFTGRNDKELAEMIGDLGASMEVTQVILQMVMQVNNTKNGYLRQFHQALVEKITSLTSDTKTLDSNQEATLAVVSGLCDQVVSQIEQQEMVEQHQKKLQELDGFVSLKDSLDALQSEKIQQLELRALEIIRVDDEQQRLIEELKRANANKDELDQIQTQRIDLLMTEVARLELAFARQEKTSQLLEGQQGILIDQVKSLELERARFNSLQALLLRNFLPFTSLIVAGIGIWFGAQ